MPKRIPNFFLLIILHKECKNLVTTILNRPSISKSSLFKGDPNDVNELRKNSIRWKKKHFPCICKPWSLRGWDLRPVTDQAEQAYQSTIHRPLLFRRCEDVLSHLTKGFQETIDNHRQKQEVPTRTLLTVKEKRWSRRKDTSIPASGHGEDRRKRECKYPDTRKTGPKALSKQNSIGVSVGIFQIWNLVCKVVHILLDT